MKQTEKGRVKELIEASKEAEDLLRKLRDYLQPSNGPKLNGIIVRLNVAQINVETVLK